MLIVLFFLLRGIGLNGGLFFFLAAKQTWVMVRVDRLLFLLSITYLFSIWRSHFCTLTTGQYAIVGRHRLAWVNYADLMQSKADLMHFAMELAKKLNIWYKNPPLPVDLNIASGNLSDVFNHRSIEMQPLIHPDDGVDSSSATGNAPSIDLKDLHSRFRPQFD